MKIIENNNKVTVECPICNSKLEIECGDINVSPSLKILYVNCGACGKPIAVDNVKGIKSLFEQQVLDY